MCTVIEEPDQEAAPSSASATGAAEGGLSLGSIKWGKLATGILQQVRLDFGLSYGWGVCF